MADATPNSGTTAHTIIPAPIATNEQHVCFICLQNDTDTPNAIWVNPCPCSLEAHEGCLLRWIAEMETTPRSNKGGLKCPACKAPITIEEPYDPLLAVRDKLYRRYSRVSPYILAVFLTSGGFAGMAWYGFGAASLFAGRHPVARWVLSGARVRMASALIKMWMLSAIGPGLVVMRWLPSLGNVVLVPFSVLYGATLVAQDDLPSWPPSPRWAVALMPLVQLSYSYLLYDLFGPLERRLNRALRGLPATEDDAAPGAEAEPAVAAPEPAAGAAAVRNEEEVDGLWGAVANLSRAIIGLFADDPAEGAGNVEVEIAEHFEIRIGGGGDDDEGEDEDDVDVGQILGEADLVEGEDEFQLLAEVAAQDEDQPQPEDQQAQQPQPQPQPPAAEQPEPQPAQPNQPPPQNQNNQNNQRRNNDGPETSYFSLIINSVATSLLLPAISYGMGELIRATAPRSWVAPAARSWRGAKTPAGLLQQQWGRSLAGGCLFVVLRDAIALYTKYRRVQVRAKRRVRNVERRAQPGSGEQTAV
ncbi:hypothetical protein C8A01DRAFT_46389 [Parachaetomium inaequale]|uniref:RING-CH-type domain-containing protein n=1 Tax=Parachaetomium inaequale TaxID=2588326 RepID=A0AAN6PHQ1_9PEZI|nr:hypothetical protein C8A01DRAFT_46389 [Parachaetomium inaequale]